MTQTTAKKPKLTIFHRIAFFVSSVGLIGWALFAANQLYVPWQAYQRQQLLAQNSVETQAVVLAYAVGDMGRDTRVMTYQFTSTTSQTLTATEYIASWAYTPTPGQRVIIHYDPHDPTIVAIVDNLAHFELFVRNSTCVCALSGLATLHLLLSFVKTRPNDA